MMRWWLICQLGLVGGLGFLGSTTGADEAYLAMGIRVGEVTQTSAIVWTRITAQPNRRSAGVPPRTKVSRTRVMVDNLPIPVEKREGAVPGTAGQIRLKLAENRRLTQAETTQWSDVDAASDYTKQFRLAHLRPARKYFLRVEARKNAAAKITNSAVGSFTTPGNSDTWQDVRFAVITGQMYYHRDSKDGFRIYPAMRKLDLKFLVPTGDTVYYDRDNPRAKSVELCRHHWHRMYSLPWLVDFHREVPGYWEKDDHDTYFDDCWPTYRAPWIEPLTYAQAGRVFREQVPIGEKLYRTIRWGKGLQIWLVEGRDFRSPNTMPDGPRKTIWGQRQKAWLKRSLLASDATFRVLIDPTPIVGPDNSKQADNHADAAFAHEGGEFRRWVRLQGLDNFFICCGDRHWQYMSVDPETGLREFSCGPTSDVHAFDGPGKDPRWHRFYRAGGGFLSVSVTRPAGKPAIAFRFHDVDGHVLSEFVENATSRIK